MPKVRAGIILAVLLLISLPYIAATRNSGSDPIFGGFFLNPIDGNTYLAKMWQGWEGAWLFRLPYTAEPGEGSYLFLFYLFLGHAAKVLGTSLIATFHIARVTSALLLLLALDRFFQAAFLDQKTATLAFFMASIGTGMGWLAALSKWVSADMWVAEAYPFLASFSNPHFPLSLTIMVWLFTPLHPRKERLTDTQPSPQFFLLLRIGFKAIVGGMILSILSPFGVIITWLVMAGSMIWQQIIERQQRMIPENRRGLPPEILEDGFYLICLAVSSAPMMFYDFWIARVQPALAGWNAQNITPTPPFWDIALSLSPAILLAFYAAWACMRGGTLDRPTRLLIVWACSGLLIFFPTNLQLRFMIGLYIPISGLAARGIAQLSHSSPRQQRNLLIAFLSLCLPTILFIQLAATYTIQTRSLSAYLTQGEARAMQWITSHTKPDTLILAAPDTGLLIPAHTGRRVIYGHPFETVNARAEKDAVEDFFRSGLESEASQKEFLAQRDVDYLFYGPREQVLGRPAILETLHMIYQQGGVEIYAVK
jgi:hypothetical protein